LASIASILFRTPPYFLSR